MKSYILRRILQSLVSVFVVSTICFLLVYSCIPRRLVFKGDQALPKLINQQDLYQDYRYTVWKKLGYIDYLTQKDYAESLYGKDSPRTPEAMVKDSPLAKEFEAAYRAKGYAIEVQPVTGFLYAYRDRPLMSRVLSWYARLFYVDHPWRVRDPGNPGLKRGYYLTRDYEGMPALAASGTTYKYQLWIDASFPFLHSNALTLRFGESYPAFEGQEVIKVIASGQGRTVKREVTATLGGQRKTFYSSVDEHSLRYKPVLEKLDYNKYDDHYADGESVYEAPSMLGVSFRIGTWAVFLGLAFGILAGVVAAMRKDKLFDKALMGYIVAISALPTLLYIALFSRFGMKVLHLPDKFPFLGPGNVLSWIMPILSLALAGIAGEAMWIRRYMVDQMNADYVRFARSKGLSEAETFFKHILRNAIIPIVHGIPAQVIGTLAGAIITESFYAVPGMGKMIPDSLGLYNNSMVVALTFIFTVVSISAVFLGDVLVTVIDPRISLQARKEAR